MTSTLCLPTHKRDESVKHPNHARGWTRSWLAYVWLVPNAPLRTRYERVTHDSQSRIFQFPHFQHPLFSFFTFHFFSSIFNQPRHHCCQLIIENLLRWDTNSVKLIKFADDTYMILPAENSGTCIAELTHIDDWAERNNLRLNCAKTKEIIVRVNGKRGQAEKTSTALRWNRASF